MKILKFIIDSDAIKMRLFKITVTERCRSYTHLSSSTDAFTDFKSQNRPLKIPLEKISAGQCRKANQIFCCIEDTASNQDGVDG